VLRALACCAALLLAPAAARADPDRPARTDADQPARTETALAWIYVESNTGSSSAGHLALRVRDVVYHVQQVPPGWYQVERESWSTFRHLYAGLQNRTLALAHLEVADADVERAHDHLAGAYVAQHADLARRGRLELDLAWSLAWRDGEPPPPLAGAGLFDPAGAPDAHALALRDALHERLGAGFLAAEIARLDAHARALPPDPGRGVELRETLLLAETLRALEAGAPLAAAALLPPAGPPLSPAEIEGCRRHAAAQEEAVLALLRSRRPDRGLALAIAAARHQAFSRSAANGALVLLDPYAAVRASLPAADDVAPEAWARRADELEALLESRRPLVLGAARYDEPRQTLLELAAAAHAEYVAGAAGRPVRRLPRSALPAAARAVAFRPAAPPAALDAAAREAEAALRAETRRLEARYRYGVVRRNCVTELVRLLNDAFGGEAARALGAELEPGAGLDFIPFAFFDSVTSRLRVARVEVVPSHRERELARVTAADPSLARRLGESITYASTIYTPRWRDGSFLFFTDDVLWRRPLLGLANFGFAAGQGVLGLLSAPFDGGRRARAAGSGLWYSLPELAFANVRKGSFAWVPAERDEAQGL
jgi:hypothetical protein